LHIEEEQVTVWPNKGDVMLHRLLRQWESPPTWLLLFIALAWLQSRYLPLVPAHGAMRLVGALLVFGGIALLGAAVLQFRAHQTTILPREVPRAMITTGVYAHSRNPIYLADALILAGCALRWDAAALILVPAFMAAIQTRFIVGEEVGMRAAFGGAYAAYVASVRRWI
jgi:protein-S-isoprenylcysteine O-methyltransferase Ste14